MYSRCCVNSDVKFLNSFILAPPKSHKLDIRALRHLNAAHCREIPFWHDAKSLYTLPLSTLALCDGSWKFLLCSFLWFIEHNSSFQSLFFTSFHELTQVILTYISKIQYSISASMFHILLFHFLMINIHM